MEKWGGVCRQRHPSPAVGGACCCAAERGLYIKGDGWVSCSLTKLSRRLIGGAGAQTIPEDSVSTKQSRDHRTKTQGLYFFVHCSVWPISFLKMLKALCWTETVWERQEEKQQQRVDFEAFVSWSRRHSCPHAGEGKTDTSQPLLPFTFSNLSSPPEDPSTGFSHAPENHEVQPFLPYRFLRGSGYV